MAGNGRKMSCIVAMATNRGIGKNGQLPWRLRSELKHFARITSTVKDKGKQNAVMMGRNTWESIPEKNRPLHGRLNIILSKTMSNAPEGVLVCSDIQQALDILSTPPYDQSIEDVFVIGGYSPFKEAMTSPNLHRIYLTRIHLDVECDVFLPEFDEKKFNVIRITFEQMLSWDYLMPSVLFFSDKWVLLETSDYLEAFGHSTLSNVPTEVQEEKGIQFQYFVYERNEEL